jgi:hypothetical protein
MGSVAAGVLVVLSVVGIARDVSSLFIRFAVHAEKPDIPFFSFCAATDGAFAPPF